MKEKAQDASFLDANYFLIFRAEGLTQIKLLNKYPFFEVNEFNCTGRIAELTTVSPFTSLPNASVPMVLNYIIKYRP
jgi:hypothetical protein